MLWLVLATVALQPCTAAASTAIVLPPDNNRGRYRDSPDFFRKPWDMPRLLDGKVTTVTVSTDMLLHSSPAYPEATIWDVFYPLAWEKDFLGARLAALCRRWWWVSYVAASLYLVFLWAGDAWMKGREPYNLKGSLAAWNLFLAVFSLIGALRTAPHLFMLLNSYGFNYTVCRAALVSYGNGATGLWVAVFIFSKYAELIDTAFLVLRKRKVGFLHWYHHCSVLLYCWHAYVWEMPTGIYFVSMNYSVHAVMYFYYFLAAACKRPPPWALLVTIMQLVQMAIGVIITLFHMHILFHGSVANCDGHVPNLIAALGMYASYFILFAQFLFRRYCHKPNNSKKDTSKKLE